MLPTYTPKVCRIMVFWAIFRGFWSIILPTFGVQVDLKPLNPESEGVFMGWCHSVWLLLLTCELDP